MLSRFDVSKNLLLQKIVLGTETDLHRCAEVALSEFERLSEFANECESEITTYLEQLIELTIKCRSPETAKKVFDKIVVQYYGNAYVERAYLKFLSKYFKDIKNEISKNLKVSNDQYYFYI